MSVCTQDSWDVVNLENIHLVLMKLFSFFFAESSFYGIMEKEMKFAEQVDDVNACKSLLS